MENLRRQRSFRGTAVLWVILGGGALEVGAFTLPATRQCQCGSTMDPGARRGPATPAGPLWATATPGVPGSPGGTSPRHAPREEWRAERAVKVVSVVPGGDARGALNASWGEVMSHVNTRMGAPKRGSGVDSFGAILWYEPLDLIDFTAFWSVMTRELPLPPSHWVYLHDTMEAGPSFRPRLLHRLETLRQALGTSAVHRVALTSQAGRSMNLGVYAHDYLLQRAPQFKADVVDSLLQLDQYGRKSAGGELEDWLLTPLGVVLTMLQDVQGSPVDVYGTGTRRKVLAYPELDLIKYQANWFVEQGGRFQMDA